MSQTPQDPNVLNSQLAVKGQRYETAKWNSLLGRIFGITFGIGTQVLFLWTVVQLFLFLRYGGHYARSQSRAGLLFDAMLAMSFALPHSLLLAPSIQKSMKRWIPAGLIGCVHCSVTCLTLLFMFRAWQSSGAALWHTQGISSWLILLGFYGSWIALFYSLYITGLGYQTGLTQWWYWLIDKPAPRREFVVQGAYRWMRHPIYMSFLGLIWFTPIMSLDHVVLTCVWTVYIYAGSYFKDQRLIRYIGQPYLEYAAQIPGLPLIGFGPLNKVRCSSTARS